MAILVREGPIALDDLTISDRLRGASEDVVQALMVSLQERGQMTPIEVRFVRKENKNHLITGLQRVEAARRLGWTELSDRIWDCTAEYARDLEIDDNLEQKELTPLHLAVALAAKKKLYDKRYPKATRGGDRKSANFKDKDQTDIMSFCSLVAQKCHLTDRHIRRYVAIGSRLAPRHVASLEKRSTSFVDLQQLIKLPPNDLDGVVEAFCEGDFATVPQARAHYFNPNGKAEIDPVDKGFLAIQAAWGAASKASRKVFMDEYGLIFKDQAR